MISRQTSQYWKQAYGMISHPEGGFYKELYRDKLTVNVPWSEKRNSSTAIVYMLENEDVSRFHRIKSDELWHLYDANTNVIIHCLDDTFGYRKLRLGYDEESMPMVVVPAGVWFAAELEVVGESSFALCGCTVSPGFDFEDFEMADTNKLLERFAEHAEIIRKINVL